MATSAGDFELTMDELRVVARFAAESAQDVLGLFEIANPKDRRPREAIDAALIFANGAARSKLQRVTAVDAHQAAKEVHNDAARHAARGAGDAASAAYLHPLADASQVGHILRATANAARAAELSTISDPAVGDERVADACRRATSVLLDVLSRYPEALAGKSRVAQLMKSLDSSLRALQ